MNKKITLSFISLTIVLISVFLGVREDVKSETEKLRDRHTEFLKNHPYNKLLKLSKHERKNLGVPPNKYFEQEYLKEINPRTGRAEVEKKLALQQELLQNDFLKNVPGSDTNAWVERGPSNVPGRTRAMLFDPNDSSNKRVFAGGVSGGLWVNDDITRSNSRWTRIGIPENLAVSSITVDPNNSNIMYVGTGESYVQGYVTGNGIWKSSDGGSSWAQIFGGPDGQSVFNGDSRVTINSPATIQGALNAVQAGFGPGITSDISGNLVLVNDGTARPTQGCNPLVNGGAISGNIAVIERANCNFTVKVKNAQDAGATAVIMINNVEGNPFVMAGDDLSITIPSVMISKSDGAPILDELSSGTVTATIESVVTSLPVGVTLVPGIFHINDIVTRNNGGTTEIYAAVADAIYREAPGTLLGNSTEYGLYKSTNGGTTWTRIDLPATTGGNPFEPNDLEISSDNTIWLSTTSSSSFGDGGGTIFSSSNGTTFTQRHVVPNAARTEIEVSGSNPNKIYVLADEDPVTILRTTNGFSTIETLSLPVDDDVTVDGSDFTRGQAFYDLMLEADPSNDEIVYVGGINSFRSTDGGSSWTKISQWFNNPILNVPIVHADIHELSFDPSNFDRGIIATDGGVYYANSFAAAGASRNAIVGIPSNYNTTQFYWGAIGQDATNDQLLGGTQDNGSNFVDDGNSGINNAEEITGGDGAYCFIDKDGDYVVTSLPFNNYRKLSLPLPSATSTIVSNDGEGDFINAAELDDNLDILFSNASTGNQITISRFTDVDQATQTRTDLSNALLTSSPTAFKVSPYTTSSTTLLVGTITGSLLKIENANASFPVWSDITGSGFMGSISAVSFGANENEIMVTFHNYGVDNIWFTQNGGATWQSKEGDFPDIPVKAIVMNPLLNDEVIIGTDLGVWRTGNFKSANPNWVQSQNGMQNVKVTSFDLRTSDNTVLASTYGRGFFTGQFTSQSLSIEEIASNDNRIQLYPIPSEGEIKMNSTIDFGAASVSVFDLSGKEVYNESKSIFGTVELNLSNLPKGAYILNVESEKYLYNKKILLK
ncbi:MAG: T9SS type A sorting domain-containing protein [Flavobacteriaceae bacterium]|nr:T9SS type A sorting domain-containing protein [Flavobacteriaceae bacterium]